MSGVIELRAIGVTARPEVTATEPNQAATAEVVEAAFEPERHAEEMVEQPWEAELSSPFVSEEIPTHFSPSETPAPIPFGHDVYDRPAPADDVDVEQVEQVEENGEAAIPPALPKEPEPVQEPELLEQPAADSQPEPGEATEDSHSDDDPFFGYYPY